MVSNGGAPEYRYDVALSLRSQDEGFALKLIDQLDELRVFMYTVRSTEIVGRSGFEAFRLPFTTDSELCVILYREGWGKTPWTRLEDEAIRERWLDEGGSRVILVNMDGSVPPRWFPRSRLWADARSEGVAGVATAIQARLCEIRTGEDGGNLIRATRTTANREAMPIAFYQRQTPFCGTSQQWVPTQGKVCDGCRKLVRFRPFVRVSVWDRESDRVIEEGFCPVCARQRNVGVTLGPGMERETVYADDNPTVEDHVTRILSRTLSGTAKDERMQSLGVDSIGSAILPHGITAILTFRDGRKCETAVLPFARLEETDALTEPTLSDLLIEHVRECLEDPDRLRDWP